MPIEFYKGDVFEFGESVDALAHGCNCIGLMGAGVAAGFQTRYKKMYEAYRELCVTKQFDLGDVFTWEAGNTVIFNLGTQKTIKRDASLQAVQRSVQNMLSEAERLNIRRIGVPLIGVGLGGLKVKDVKALLSAIAFNSPITLCVVSEFQRKMVPEKLPSKGEKRELEKEQKRRKEALTRLGALAGDSKTFLLHLAGHSWRYDSSGLFRLTFRQAWCSALEALMEEIASDKSLNSEILGVVRDKVEAVKAEFRGYDPSVPENLKFLLEEE